MAPFELSGAAAHLVELAIGLAFGFVLESSGFGDARRLAAQFYFRELRVVQTMFTAIVTAMLLLFISAGLGWLDLDQVWVNPTFVPSVTVGGLIFGVGFTIGGYCPGTSLAALATGKLDALFFVAGSMLGMFAFGETADHFRDFYYAGHYGHFMLTDLLGVSTGTAALLVVLLALGFFGGLKLVARRLGHERPVRWPRALAGAALLLALAGTVAAIGQPSLDAKWQRLAAKHQGRLARREVFIEPAELLALRADRDLNLLVLDVRPEADWNQFHLAYSERLPLEALAAERRRFTGRPDPSAVVVVSNDETAAARAWRHLTVLGVPNVYVLAGGINRWIATYRDAVDRMPARRPLADEGDVAGARDLLAAPAGAGAALPTPPANPAPSARPIAGAVAGDDALHWRFPAALGDRHPLAAIDPLRAPKLPFNAKVKLQRKGKKSGGCG